LFIIIIIIIIIIINEKINVAFSTKTARIRNIHKKDLSTNKPSELVNSIYIYCCSR